MSIKKKCKVVILTTKDTTTNIWLNKKEQLFFHPDTSITSLDIPQHLYILSYDEIKKGDWFYIKEIHSQGQLRKCWEIYSNEYSKEDSLMIDDPKDPKIGFGFCKRNEVIKIIASTDPKLNLPKPSEDFLIKYCEKGGIDEVMVEFEKYCVYGDDCPSKGAFTKQHLCKIDIKPKINSQNEVSISKVKDTWNREEVMESIYNALGHFSNKHNIVINGNDLDTWIKENL